MTKVGIQLGTFQCGIVIEIDGKKSIIKFDHQAQSNIRTIILYTKRNTIFGDEAWITYSRNPKKKGNNYYSQFLHQVDLENWDTLTIDFVNHLKGKALEFMTEKRVQTEHVHFVVQVPNNWDEKQMNVVSSLFPNGRVDICNGIDAIICQSVCDKIDIVEPFEFSVLDVGYISKMATFRIQNGIHEVVFCSGSTAGYNKMDGRFLSTMKSVIGSTTYDEAIEKEPFKELILLEQWNQKKRTFTGDEHYQNSIFIKIPNGMAENVEEIELKFDALQFLFDDSLNEITKLINDHFLKLARNSFESHIVYVSGGLTEATYIRKKLNEKFKLEFLDTEIIFAGVVDYERIKDQIHRFLLEDCAAVQTGSNNPNVVNAPTTTLSESIALLKEPETHKLSQRTTQIPPTIPQNSSVGLTERNLLPSPIESTHHPNTTSYKNSFKRNQSIHYVTETVSQIPTLLPSHQASGPSLTRYLSLRKLNQLTDQKLSSPQLSRNPSLDSFRTNMSRSFSSNFKQFPETIDPIIKKDKDSTFNEQSTVNPLLKKSFTSLSSQKKGKAVILESSIGIRIQNRTSFNEEYHASYGYIENEPVTHTPTFRILQPKGILNRTNPIQLEWIPLNQNEEIQHVLVEFGKKKEDSGVDWVGVEPMMIAKIKMKESRRVQLLIEFYPTLDIQAFDGPEALSIELITKS